MRFWVVEKKVFFSMLAIGIAFCLVEIILHVFGFVHINNNTFDNNGLIVFKPNITFGVKDVCYSAQIQTNSLGFHSRDYAIPKPPNIFRIVVLGDSFVESAQVSLEQTFFSQLEKKLNETTTSSLRYEVIPIAKSGHGTLMNLLFAREYALRFKPDLIIDSFITNDLKEDFFDVPNLNAIEKADLFDPMSLHVATLSENKKKVLYLKHFILERSILLERLWMNGTIIKSHLSQSKISIDKDREDDLLLETLLYPEGKIGAQLWDTEAKALASMSSFAKENKIRFLVVHLTEGFLFEKNFRDQWNVDQSQKDTFDMNAVRNRLRNISVQKGFAFFSTQEYFEKKYQESHLSPVWSCDNHYNEIGHQWVSDSLFDFLILHKKEFLTL